MAVIFSDGVPAKITASDFKRAHLASFPRFASTQYDGVLQEAIDSVYDMFTGVRYLWKNAGEEEWYQKTVRCYLLLTAWYIADVYPRFALGIQSSGGMPILRKKIGDLDIHYMDTSRLSTADAVLESLRSNPYGGKALMMIRGAPSRFILHVHKTIGGA